MSIATESPITLQEVAKHFGVGIRTVHSWIRRERNPLQAWKVGGMVVTTKSAIEAFGEPVNLPVRSRNETTPRQASQEDISRREKSLARIKELTGRT